MIFRQLFDRKSCTYTYLLADETTHEALLIDPVRELVDRDVELLTELGLTLRFVLDTHVHADHVTAAGLLRQRLGARTAVSADAGAPCADVRLEHGATLQVGAVHVEARHTPGHTSGDVTYVVRDADATMAFTGDALLIRGCGRTDFQEGDSRTLYHSVHTHIFSLPDATRIYPAHDYKGRTVTTVGEEKQFNPRLGGGRTVDEFVTIMDALDLDPPEMISDAVPANLQCGNPIADVARPAPVPSWAPLVRTSEGIPEVDGVWAREHAHEVRVIDVREPDELAALPSLDGAENVPLGDLAEALQSWLPSRDPAAPVLLVCRSGRRSGIAARMMEEDGYRRVASVAGGMMELHEN